MYQLALVALSVDPHSGTPVIFLRTTSNSHLLPIWTGSAEARAIFARLQGQPTPRPLTHDLFCEAMDAMNIDVERVSITHIENSVFYAELDITRDGETAKLDARPSDAIAIAIRCGAPIFASDQVIESGGVPIDLSREEESIEEVVSEFRDFLDHINPDDFKAETN